MRNISQVVALLVLLASQVNVPFGTATASAQGDAQAVEIPEVGKININTPRLIEFGKLPNFDTEVWPKLRAEQARIEAAKKAALVAAASKPRAYTVSTVLPAGSHTDWMRAAGIAESDFGYVDYIIGRESGWGVTKSNYSGSGAYGLGQALPASKMAPFGADYLTNPVTQLRWANSYAVGRYGSWAGAYAFWTARHYW